jgi:excisionase family DNA binding protein
MDVDKEILNMDEASELFNVSIKTFIKLLKEEKVPARKIGREWRFSRQALIQWLSSGDSQQYSSSDSDTKEFFDKVAPEWEIMRSGYYDADVIGRLLETNLLEDSMTLVDLGAGDGYLSRAVSPHVGTVIAIDISGAMLEELSKKAAKEGMNNIRTVVSDGRDMPLADNSADIVCANMFLHHIEEPVTAAREMYRVLKPGGKVFLADLKEHDNEDFKEKMHDIWQGFSEEEVQSWFKKSGFKSVQIDSDISKGTGRKNSGKKNSGRNAMEGIFIMIAKK